ncbi:MAG: PEP-CTERM sorting domain-containing protein [Pirellulales bacterium]|nr:PEP-CTERM sorting domain-containing protein [Pirellulales bacterium]
MNKLFAIFAVSCVAIAANANAASISVQQNGDIYSLYIQGVENNIAALGFSAAPVAPATFLNPNSGNASGAPRPAGQAFTYRNRFLDLDPADEDVSGGLGWTLLNTSQTAGGLTFEGGPLGQLIDISAPVFLANIMLTPGGSATYQVLLKDGTGADIGAPLTGTIPVPEPATFVLAGISMLGLAAVRRRMA